MYQIPFFNHIGQSLKHINARMTITTSAKYNVYVDWVVVSKIWKIPFSPNLASGGIGTTYFGIFSFVCTNPGSFLN
jgi:hypothetical protein